MRSSSPGSSPSTSLKPKERSPLLSERELRLLGRIDVFFRRLERDGTEFRSLFCSRNVIFARVSGIRFIRHPGRFMWCLNSDDRMLRSSCRLRWDPDCMGLVLLFSSLAEACGTRASRRCVGTLLLRAEPAAVAVAYILALFRSLL